MPIAAAAVTVSVTLEVCVTPPPVALIVRLEEPTGVLALVVTVSVELPEPPLTLAGEKLAVAPAGSPLTLKLTALLKPPVAAMLLL
jgi:hypothetical protein